MNEGLEREIAKERRDVRDSESQAQTLPHGHCLNCDEPLRGAFCYRCGQKSDVRSFTLKSLFTDLYESVRSVDLKFRKTFMALLKSPAEFCRQYLSGKREPYVTPGKYFFVSFVFQVTVLGLVRHISTNPDIDEAAHVSNHFQLLSLIATFFWACALSVVFRRAGYNLAENTVCMLFLSGETQIFFVLIQVVLLPTALFLRFEREIATATYFAVTTVYFVTFCRRFYGESWLATVLKTLVVVLIFVIVFLPLIFLELVLKALIQLQFR